MISCQVKPINVEKKFVAMFLFFLYFIRGKNWENLALWHKNLTSISFVMSSLERRFEVRMESFHVYKTDVYSLSIYFIFNIFLSSFFFFLELWAKRNPGPIDFTDLPTHRLTNIWLLGLEEVTFEIGSFCRYDN